MTLAKHSNNTRRFVMEFEVGIDQAEVHDMIAGTCLKGYLHTTFADLVAKFGPSGPLLDDFKIDAMWVIKFEDGTVASIYNYRDGKHSCGDDGLDVEDITVWHIGRKYWMAIDALRDLFGDKVEDARSEAK